MRFVILLLAATAGLAQTLTVGGVAPSQAFVSFTSPSGSACTIELSESNTYLPLADDVDPAKYTNANLDTSRPSTVVNGLARKIVLGTRRYERGLDGRIYSRGLKADTLYYLRLGGACSATTTFTTAIWPFGRSYSDAPVTSSEFAGALVLPTVYDSPRGTRVIDPVTGTAIYRVSAPGDAEKDQQLGIAFTGVVASTNWVNPNNILANDGSSATYSGASCGGTCDFINVEVNPFDTYPDQSSDNVTLYLKGSGSDASASNRTVQACLSFTTTCLGVFKTLVLPTSTGIVSTPVVEGDMWMPPTAYSQLLSSDINTAGKLRVLIRKTTGTGTISLDYADFDLNTSASFNMYDGGNESQCSIVADGSGFFLCVAAGINGRTTLYRIKSSVSPPDIRYLGAILNVNGLGDSCYNVGFDVTLPYRMYCQPSSTTTPYQLDYSGDGTNKQQPYTAEFTKTQLSANLTADVKAFVTANSAQYTISFDDTKFTGCTLASPPSVQNGYIPVTCLRGGQDTYAWMAVWKLGVGIVAAYPTWLNASTRWCGLHSVDDVGNQPVFSFITHFFTGGTGAGPYTTALAGNILAGTTSFTVTAEPTSISQDTSIGNAQVGDTFSIGGLNDLGYITAKTGLTWTVVRLSTNYSNPTPHLAGAPIQMICAQSPFFGLYDVFGQNTVWDYIHDPYGHSSDGSFIWGNENNGHETARLNRFVGETGSWAQSATGTNIVATVKNITFPYSITADPPFASRIPPADGASYQNYPNNLTVLGTSFLQSMYNDYRFLDIGFSAKTPGCDPTKLLPTVNGCVAQRVPGTSNVYKYTFFGSNRPQPTLAFRQMPVYGASGFSYLAPLSGPASLLTDASPPGWCYVVIAAECRPDSSAGDMYLVAPSIDRFYCYSSVGGTDLCLQERAGGTLGPVRSLLDVTGTNLWRSMEILSPNTTSYSPRAALGAKSIPDGSALEFMQGRVERTDLWIAVNSVQTPDSLNRMTFVNVPLTISSVPGGTATAMAEFGYDENFTCSENRSEPCYAVLSGVSETTPFLWASELQTSSGVSCVTSCTIALPAITDRVMYSKVIYRNSSGATISSDPVSLTVAGPTTPLAPTIVTSCPLPAGIQSVPYSNILSATGTAPIGWTISAGSLPTGLSLVIDTITGTPTGSGTSSFSIQATNTVGVSTNGPIACSLTINSSPTRPTITTTCPLPPATQFVAYSTTLTASGDVPITWTISSGSLPTGLNLSGAVVSGTPTVNGSSSFGIQATNLGGASTNGPVSCSLVVSGAATGVATSTVGAASVSGRVSH